MTTRTNWLCEWCGSDNVIVDAYAAWDVETQQWCLVDTCEKEAFCYDCNHDADGRTSVKEVTE